MQKIFGIIGWIGTALVFGAVAVRMFYPEWNQYATYAAWRDGLVLIYMAGQWRDVAEFYKGRGAKVRHHVDRQHRRVPGVLIAVNYPRHRRTRRWDLTGNQVYASRTDHPHLEGAQRAGARNVSSAERMRKGDHRTAWMIPVPDHQAPRRDLDPDREPTRAAREDRYAAKILLDYRAAGARLRVERND